MNLTFAEPCIINMCFYSLTSQVAAEYTCKEIFLMTSLVPNAITPYLVVHHICVSCTEVFLIKPQCEVWVHFRSPIRYPVHLVEALGFSGTFHLLWIDEAGPERLIFQTAC